MLLSFSKTVIWTCLALLVKSVYAQEPDAEFVAILTGSKQDPPVATGVNGVVNFYYFFDFDVITYNVEIVNPDGIEIAGGAGIHIHCGSSTESGPVAVTLATVEDATTDPSSQFSGFFTSANITDAGCGTTINDLFQSQIYVNVHSSENPAGEVRGQIFIGLGISLSAEPSVTSSTSFAAGFIDFAFDPVTEVMEFRFWIFNPLQEEMFGAAGAHIHCGTPEENGNIVVPLVDAVADTSTVVTSLGTFAAEDVVAGECAADFEALLTLMSEGGAYINVHSTQNPSGALFGSFGASEEEPELAAIGANIYGARLLGSNQIPPLESDVTGNINMAFVPGESVGYWTLDIDSFGVNVELFGGNGAGIYCGGPDEIGQVAVVFFEAADAITTSNVFEDGTFLDEDVIDVGCGTTVVELFQAVEEGRAYFNVHSTENPDGEIRGQFRQLAGLTSELLGENESPPVESTVSAFYSFYSTATMRYLIYDAFIENPDSINIFFPVAGSTGCHLHCAPPGENGPIIASLDETSFGASYLYGFEVTDSPCGNDIPSLFNAMLKGMVYVNIHSEENPTGEVRGNIGAGLEHVSIALTAEQEVNSTPDTIASGIGTFAYDGLGSIQYVLIIENPNIENIFGTNGAHIHCGGADANGGIIVPLVPAVADINFQVSRTGAIEQSDITAGLCASTVDELWALMNDGGVYVNVHSTENPAGVIRGNFGDASGEIPPTAPPTEPPTFEPIPPTEPPTEATPEPTPVPTMVTPEPTEATPEPTEATPGPTPAVTETTAEPTPAPTSSASMVYNLPRISAFLIATGFYILV